MFLTKRCIKFRRKLDQQIILLAREHINDRLLRGGPSIGHGCTHVHPITVANRSNLAGKIMVRSEYKYHTLGFWVFDFAKRYGKGGE
jgi:hypothetical protein